MKNVTKILLLLCVLPVFAAERLTIYTVNYPLQYIAERIGGKHVSVHFPVPSDVDPAFWKPDAKIIQKYQQADLILLNGAGYAKWINKATLPRLRMVDTSRGFQDQYIEESAKTTHSHGPSDDHSHTGTAFTTWLDLQQATQQADAIKRAMIKRRPQHKAVFETNFNDLEKDLLSLDAEMKDIVQKIPDLTMFASHPVYQYLARRYAMKLHSVTWEPDVFPNESHWNEMQKLAHITSTKWMIWEGDPLQSSIDKLQSLGIGSLVFDPCSNRPDKGDFLSVMQENVKKLRQLLQGQ